MADEERFNGILKASKAFTLVKKPRFKILNPKRIGSITEIDNIAQKGSSIFVFEGSRGPPNLSQLRERFFLFAFNKKKLISDNTLLPYNNIRVFYYNLKKQRLVEFDERGKDIQTWPYGNINELILFLRNL